MVDPCAGPLDPAAKRVADASNAMIDALHKSAVTVVTHTDATRTRREQWFNPGGRRASFVRLPPEGWRGTPSLAPAMDRAASLDGRPSVVIVAASAEFADSAEALAASASALHERQDVHVLAVGGDVDFAGLTALANGAAARAKTTGEVAGAVAKIDRAIERIYHSGRIEVVAAPGIRLIGGPQAGATADNRRAVVGLGHLALGYRYDYELLFIADHGLAGEQPIATLTLAYEFRDPKPAAGRVTAHRKKTMTVTGTFAD